ncbi:hypothetical protein NDU88_000723 [Pleurodeles waltl]|uniref:Uncharacterized protein n=1 Tax=Pleurodeles waltl TaxID=8319 RepID=A0AAV7L7E1_PLEWA|nr:hypothetical protein NDU88_000723 [Pleurodeles waltl]
MSRSWTPRRAKDSPPSHVSYESGFPALRRARLRCHSQSAGLTPEEVQEPAGPYLAVCIHTRDAPASRRCGKVNQGLLRNAYSSQGPSAREDPDPPALSAFRCASRGFKPEAFPPIDVVVLKLGPSTGAFT